jgi:hypothetical protein
VYLLPPKLGQNCGRLLALLESAARLLRAFDVWMLPALYANFSDGEYTIYFMPVATTFQKKILFLRFEIRFTDMIDELLSHF